MERLPNQDLTEFTFRMIHHKNSPGRRKRRLKMRSKWNSTISSEKLKWQVSVYVIKVNLYVYNENSWLHVVSIDIFFRSV
jgi:hypothetical protein